MPADAVQPYSIDAYRTLMSGLVRDGFAFASFSEAPAVPGKTVYLRHDVDYSIELAETLAEVNSDLGIRGTFFIQVRAQLYNVFAPYETERLRRILSLGQGIALHYVVDNGATGPNIQLDIQNDFELLAGAVPAPDKAFSWHRPTAELLDGPEIEVPGLVNAYSRRLFRDIAYLSDSTHRCSVYELEAALARHDANELQLLLHPVNWVAGGSSGVEILIRGWIRVLREHERTLNENRTYADRFPHGMPRHLLRNLERGLLTAAGRPPG